MNLYTQIAKLKDRLEDLEITVTLDENEDLEGKLPIVCIEAGRTDGLYITTGLYKVEQHNVDIHCIVSAQNDDFITACENAENLANTVIKQMQGLNIKVKPNGVDRAGYLVGAEKARAVILECIASE